MVIVKCPLCPYQTEDVEGNVVTALLNLHAMSHSQQAPAPVPPKLERPRIDVGVEEEVWNNFMRRWEAFRVGSGINATAAPMQLFQCATGALGDLVLKSDPDIHNKNIATVISVMRSFSVIPVATGVRRAELMQLRQAPDETFRSFAAKVQGKAETCAFHTSTKCTCGLEVTADYTTATVKDVLLAGIADLDIRREALSLKDIHKLSINDVISFVEDREMARNATPVTNSLSALSSYRKGVPQAQHAAGISNKTAPCPDCKKQFHKYKQRANGSWNTKPFSKCLDCWRAGRRKPEDPPQANCALSTGSVVQQVSALETIDPTKIISKCDLRTIRRKPNEHPRVQVKIATVQSGKWKMWHSDGSCRQWRNV